MKSPPIPRFPEVPGLAKYLEDLSRVIEMNSQPQTGSQPYDPNLQSLSAPFGLTAAGLALLDDANAASQLTTLGVSAYIKTLLDDADAAAARATLSIGWETIEVAALTNVASYARTGLSPFRVLRAIGVAIPATNSVSAGWRTDANGGASYDAGITDYFVQDTRGKAAVASAAGPNANAIYLNDTTAISNSAGYGLWFNIHFFEFNKATIGTMIFNAGYNDAAGVLNNVSGAAFRNNTAARDAIEFKFTAGNISTGVMILEGFRG